MTSIRRLPCCFCISTYQNSEMLLELVHPLVVNNTLLRYLLDTFILTDVPRYKNHREMYSLNFEHRTYSRRLIFLIAYKVITPLVSKSKH